MLPASKLRGCRMPGKCSSELKKIWEVRFVWIIDVENDFSQPAPIAFLQRIPGLPTPAKNRFLEVNFRKKWRKTRIIWVFQQNFEEIRFLNRCVRAKKFSSVPAPIALIGGFPDLPRKMIPVIPRRILWILCGNGQYASRALFFAAVGLSTLKTKLRRSRRS